MSEDKSPQRRRIVFLCHSPHLNGAQRMLANFILAMDRRRIEPVVIARAMGPGIKVLQDAGIPCFEVPFALSLPLLNNGDDLRSYLARIDEWSVQLERAMVNLEPDLVLVNTGVVLQGLLAAKSAGLPAVVDLRAVMGRAFVVHGAMLPRPSLPPLFSMFLDPFDSRREVLLDGPPPAAAWAPGPPPLLRETGVGQPPPLPHGASAHIQ